MEPIEATMWEKIVEYEIATNEEIGLVVDVAGFKVDTLNEIVYSRTEFETLDEYIKDKEKK